MVSVPAWLVPAWDSGVVSSVGGVPSAKEESPAWLPAPSKWRGLGKLVPGSPSPGETEEWAQLGAPGGEGTGRDRQGGGVPVSRQSWLNRLPGLVRPSRGHRCPVLAPTLPTGARGSGGVPASVLVTSRTGDLNTCWTRGPLPPGRGERAPPFLPPQMGSRLVWRRLRRGGRQRRTRLL